MFAGQAWGQSMNTFLAGSNAVPSNASLAFIGGDSIGTVDYPRQVPDNANVNALLQDSFPDVGDTSLDDAGQEGIIDNDEDIVDWVLVQARVVDTDAPAPVAADFCNNNSCPTKAALLRSNGEVTEVDEVTGDFTGITVFDDLDFDPDTQDLYIAVLHRSHLAVLSRPDKSPEITENEDGAYVYDFGDRDSIHQNYTGTVKNISAIRGAYTGDAVAMSGGNSNMDASVDGADYNAVNIGRVQGASLYSLANLNLDSGVDGSDYNVVNRGRAAGIAPGVEFFPTP